MRQLDSQSISVTQRKLGMQGITGDLRAALANELSQLTPYSLRVTVAGSVRKGQIVVRVKLDAKHCADGVAQILSDGEQRVLSMAFFLAELAVHTNRSAIVLDDPATSLDQARCECVAQRLVGESHERQVIVFTNDLAFLRLLQSQARSEGVSCHGQTLLRAGEEVGIVNGELDPELLDRHKPELHSVPDIAARRGSPLDAVTPELVGLS
jgi:recombinational DNA repair ATPase RecF